MEPCCIFSCVDSMKDEADGGRELVLQASQKIMHQAHRLQTHAGFSSFTISVPNMLSCFYIYLYSLEANVKHFCRVAMGKCSILHTQSNPLFINHGAVLLTQILSIFYIFIALFLCFTQAHFFFIQPILKPSRPSSTCTQAVEVISFHPGSLSTVSSLVFE